MVVIYSFNDKHHYGLRHLSKLSILPYIAGNGYIEGNELENFFSQLEIARRGAGVVSIEADLTEILLIRKHCIFQTILQNTQSIE